MRSRRTRAVGRAARPARSAHRRRRAPGRPPRCRPARRRRSRPAVQRWHRQVHEQPAPVRGGDGDLGGVELATADLGPGRGPAGGLRPPRQPGVRQMLGPREGGEVGVLHRVRPDAGVRVGGDQRRARIVGRGMQLPPEGGRGVGGAAAAEDGFGGAVELAHQLALPAVPHPRSDRADVGDGQEQQEALALRASPPGGRTPRRSSDRRRRASGHSRSWPGGARPATPPARSARARAPAARTRRGRLARPPSPARRPRPCRCRAAAWPGTAPPGSSIIGQMETESGWSFTSAPLAMSAISPTARSVCSSTV